MDDWRRIPVPETCERMIGFSVPWDGVVLVVSYEGTHLVTLGPPAAVETDPGHCEYDLYDPRSGVCRHRGKEWHVIGLHPGRPILVGREGKRLVLDSAA